MKAPALPVDEEYRIQALRGLGLLDTAPDPDFDAIVAVGRDLFSVPICLVTLVDTDRQWFKARSGLEVPETARSVSFCGHAILGEDVFVVLDASEDARFHDNPLVTGVPFIRFYAGAPIRLPSGYTIGTVCVISPEPKPDFGAEEQAKLTRLSGLALNAIAVRGLRAALDEARMNTDQLIAALGLVPLPVALADEQGIITTCNEAFASLHGNSPEGRFAADMFPEFAGLTSNAADRDLDVVAQHAGATLRMVRVGSGYAFIGSAIQRPGA